MRVGFILSIILFSGCSSTVEPDFSIIGEDFLPLKTGDFYIFSVSEIGYNSDGSADTSNYFLREEVADSFATQDQEYISFTINRFQKSAIQDEWAYFETIALRKNSNHVVSVDGNVPIISFAFPALETNKWDGNSQNDMPPDFFEQRHLDHPFSVDSITFANTVHVFQEDLIDSLCIANDDYRVEVYARDVGLIYRRFRLVDYIDWTQNEVERCTIEMGMDLEQKLVSFGTE